MTDIIESPRQRLHRLRAELAEREAVATAPAEAQLRLPVPGTTIHCLVSGTTISTGTSFTSRGAVLDRGTNITVTADMIEGNRDAGGRYRGPALVHDADAQIAAHGCVLFAPGPAPSDMVPERGTPTWREQRENARQAAHREADPVRRRAALDQVERKHGPAPTTSTILNSTPDPSIKLAEQQRAELDAQGLRLKWSYDAVEPGVKVRR
ncbi:hypothetical protein [Microbacterium sp. W4I20]|uniref:hypothetical protein n=1 Tax=Microbacterium sp. W4I20 TaxID=3042262 RepID=UPI00277D499E|nr:hypothetical protein [Microbacterium sp. W4I20]MDQ0725694.1 hypothetical protein [Microbacterium sp. W4I20]